MAKRRPTVPFEGIFAHREHRSKKARTPNYNYKRRIRTELRERLDELKTESLVEEIKDLNT